MNVYVKMVRESQTNARFTGRNVQRECNGNNPVSANLLKRWSREWELNPRPADYESAALPLSYLGQNPYKQRRSALPGLGSFVHISPKNFRTRPSNVEGCQGLPPLYGNQRLLFRHGFDNSPASTFRIAFTVVALDFITM